MLILNTVQQIRVKLTGNTHNGYHYRLVILLYYYIKN